ncbi:Cytochrome b-c1 complex subunit 8 [Hordeum vulgare]|nr:Cytochrome b-c1 complex subunit 8 [Hordeum vulgare]
MKAVVYALSSFQQQVMPGLWKDITTKIHHKVSENWISTTLRRGSLEVPRLDYEASEDAPLIGLDAAAGDQAYAECASAAGRSAPWCRSVTVTFTVVLLLRHFITLVTVGAANQQQRAFHEIQLSPEKPPTATAFVLHGLLGSGRNWRTFSRTLASQLRDRSPSDDNCRRIPPFLNAYIMEIQSALASGMCGAGHAVARWPRVVFMFGAMTCLFVSAAAHLLASHTRRFNRLFSQLNYAGYGELFSRYTDNLNFQFSSIICTLGNLLEVDLQAKRYHFSAHNLIPKLSCEIANKILNKKELEFYKWEVLQRIHARQWMNEQTILEQSSQQHPSMCGRNYNQLNHRSKSSF